MRWAFWFQERSLWLKPIPARESTSVRRRRTMSSGSSSTRVLVGLRLSLTTAFEGPKAQRDDRRLRALRRRRAGDSGQSSGSSRRRNTACSGSGLDQAQPRKSCLARQRSDPHDRGWSDRPARERPPRCRPLLNRYVSAFSVANNWLQPWHRSLACHLSLIQSIPLPYWFLRRGPLAALRTSEVARGPS